MSLPRQLAFAVLLSAAAGLAQEPKLIPREVLFGNPEKASPKISPDGKMLAYLAPDQGVRNVWVRTIGKKDDRVVTSDRKRGISIYFWQPDSRHILYLQDVGGSEDFHVYQTSVASKETRDLTPFDGVRAQIVSVEPEIPDQVLVALNRRDKRFFDVHRLNFKTGELQLDTQNPGDVAGWTADNAMQLRAATVYVPGGGQEIRIRETTGSRWKTFQKWGPEETPGGAVAFSPDNKALWVISSVDANAARLIEVDVASGKTKVLAQDPQYDLSGAMVHPKKKTLEAVRFIRAKGEWQVIDKSIEPDFKVLRKVREGDFSVISRDLADKTWIVSYTTDIGPVYYYTYDRASRKASFLFSNRPALEKYELAKMEPISFKARDGMTLYGYLTMPVGVKKKAPMVLLVHGGPWGRDVWGFNSIVQMLANRGYGVLQVNFRGSAGYGKEYMNAGDREWAGKMHDDLVDGKRWAIQQGYANPEKVAIMGGSYGGYATLVGLTFTPDEFACGVDIVGPSNLFTLLSTIPPYWTTIKAMFERRVGSTEKDADFLRSRSPLFKAHQIKKPLLIGQGANDPRVKQAESDQIVKAMRDKNIPVTYILFPDEGHGFVRPENNLRFMAAADQFLAKCLGGRYEPPSEQEKWEAFLK